MQPTAILLEIDQLNGVSDRLCALADQNPLVSAVLIGIAGSVRNSATVLGVLVVTKIFLAELLAAMD